MSLAPESKPSTRWPLVVPLLAAAVSSGCGGSGPALVLDQEVTRQAVVKGGTCSLYRETLSVSLEVPDESEVLRMKDPTVHYELVTADGGDLRESGAELRATAGERSFTFKAEMSEATRGKLTSVRVTKVVEGPRPWQPDVARLEPSGRPFEGALVIENAVSGTLGITAGVWLQGTWERVGTFGTVRQWKGGLRKGGLVWLVIDVPPESEVRTYTDPRADFEVISGSSRQRATATECVFSIAEGHRRLRCEVTLTFDTHAVTSVRLSRVYNGR